MANANIMRENKTTMIPAMKHTRKYDLESWLSDTISPCRLFGRADA
jgi:hypothetical protein